MEIYWVKSESLFLPQAQMMQKLVKNLTIFLSDSLLSLNLKFTTLTHAPFEKILNHSLALGLSVTLIHLL
jgi:hypothetical protein